MHKKFYSVMLTLAMAALFMGCGGSKQQPDTPSTQPAPETQKETEQTAETQKESEAAPETQVTETRSPEELAAEAAAEKLKEAEEKYASILQDYKATLEAKPDMDTLSGKEMSMVIGMMGDNLTEQIGYAFADLDENGTLELLIGHTGESNELLNAYTLFGDEPLRLLTGEERNRYMLMNDNRIYNIASGGAADTEYYYLVVEGDFLYNQQQLAYNTDKDASNPWFDVDGENFEPIDQEYFEETIQDWEDAVVKPEYIPFAQLQ